jgi:fumarate reductase flavoprotein subunit
MTGGVHGAAYMNGTAFSKGMAFGRIAARTIAEAAGK